MELVGQVLGPFLGGIITPSLSWRWCFLINVPLGFISVCGVFIIMRQQVRVPQGEQSWKLVLSQFDWLGTASLVSGTVLLLLALEWAGSSYSWSDPVVIGSLSGGMVLLVLFLLVEFSRNGKTLLPLNLLKQRSFAFSMAYAFCSAAALGGIDYYVCYGLHSSALILTFCSYLYGSKWSMDPRFWDRRS